MDPASTCALWSGFRFDGAMESRKEPASRSVDEMPYGPRECGYQLAESLAPLAVTLDFFNLCDVQVTPP